MFFTIMLMFFDIFIDCGYRTRMQELYNTSVCLIITLVGSYTF